MRASSHIGAGGLAFAALCAPFAFTGCGVGDAQLGEPCADSSECDEALQCLERVCTRRCNTHIDCGDGYTCERGGECAVVLSAIGDPCRREIDCGPAQACVLQSEDLDQDGALTGICQLQTAGKTIGSACRNDDECQVGVCALGLCTQLCRQGSDCPPGLACASIPRLLEDSAPRFSGCLPGRGVISHDIAMSSPSGSVRVPVPSHAQSFALVAQIDEEDQVVGATRVVAPGGEVLYTEPRTADDFYANAIRYGPGLAISTLLMSNTPSVDLEVGAYQVHVESKLPDGGDGTAVPRLRVLYKIDTGTTLDLHFHFLDLTSHPCAEAFDGSKLDATTAPESPSFGGYLTEIEEVFAAAGVLLGDVTYHDITDRDDLDGVERDSVGELFARAEQESGINVFLVRSIAPAGVEAVVGATPGPPRTAGTLASGVAVGLDTLCYRGWPALARITAHAIARQMGLYYNRDPGGHPDTIADSDELSTNLMFFGDLGGESLSSGQQEVLRRYPGLR